MLFVVSTISFLLLTQVALPIMVAFERSHDPQLPNYSENTVQAVCQLLELEDTNSFCVTPSDQNAITLSHALNHTHPPEITSYDDIIYLMGNLESVSQEASLDGQNFKKGGCPQSDSEEFECYFIFPGEVGMVSVRFNAQSQVIEYLITNEKGGTK